MSAIAPSIAGDHRPAPHSGHAPAPNPFRQPKAVWAVALACVVSFMGIGLVDPILPALSEQLDASASQVELLFTSYLVVTAVAMLVTGFVSSRIGAKRTLIAGLSLIVVFSAAAGMSDTINQIVGFRAGWGLGNALFIATSLAVIVGAASGGFAGAIILYETALGVGIASGPLVGGLLGGISWRGPFFGVTVLMAIALFASMVALIGVVADHQAALIAAVVLTGVFIGVNNTITTQAVMTVSPVQRPIASASYGFVRFIGGGMAPFFAGKIAEAHGVHMPFYVGAVAVALSIAVLATGHKLLAAAEEKQAAIAHTAQRDREALLVQASAEEFGDAT